MTHFLNTQNQVPLLFCGQLQKTMLSLVNYTSDDEEEDKPQIAAPQRNTVQPRAAQQETSASRRKATKRKHTKKLNTQTLFSKLGIDLNDMKNGKLKTSIFADDTPEYEDEKVDEDETGAQDVPPPSKRSRFGERTAGADPDAPIVEQEDNEEGQLESSAHGIAFTRGPRIEVAELPDGVEQPAMLESSSFMQKFNALVSPDHGEMQQAQQSLFVQEEAELEKKMLPKPIFAKVESTIASKMQKQDTIVVEEASISGVNVNLDRQAPTKHHHHQKQQITPSTTALHDEDLEFELTAGAYDEEEEEQVMEQMGQSSDEEHEAPLQTAPEGEEILVHQEQVLQHQGVNGAPSLPLDFLLQQGNHDDEQYTHEYDPPLEEEEETITSTHTPIASSSSSLPQNLPRHVLEQLNKPGVSIVNVSGVPSEYLDEAQRRKVVIEKYRRSMYQAPTQTVDFDNIEKMPRGGLRHQLSTMARNLAEKELEMAEKQERGNLSRRQAWRRYGWS